MNQRGNPRGGERKETPSAPFFRSHLLLLEEGYRFERNGRRRKEEEEGKRGRGANAFSTILNRFVILNFGWGRRSVEGI